MRSSVPDSDSIMPELLYPETASARTRWILAQRGPKNRHDPRQPYAYFWEEERDAGGQQAATATLFLTNKECPYRCLMCDLWQDTLDTRVPVGAIPSQIAYALERLPAARQIKLYNAGSFFDPQAIPPEDYPEIAHLVASFERVIVECHPALIGPRLLSFRDLLSARLEIAIGLETVHTETLARLNKRITVASFQRAAAFLQQNQMDLRVFLLLHPPFLSEEEGVTWAQRSLEVAFDAGATVCSLIPTRDGNGAMEVLRVAGLWEPPQLASLETAQEHGLRLEKGRVFSDLWDLGKRADCACAPLRIARLTEMNRTQRIPPPVLCDRCGTRRSD